MSENTYVDDRMSTTQIALRDHVHCLLCGGQHLFFWL